MKFKLQQKGARLGASGLSTFSVLDEKGVTRGTISVPSSESDDLIASWKGQYVAAKPTGTSAMAKVLMEKRTKVSKEALLRGC